MRTHADRRRGFPAALLTAGMSLAAPAPPAALPAPAEPLVPRYDLRAGDRLVYRETLHRESLAERADSAADLEWTSELLVLGTVPEGAVVGIERRRVSAELVRANDNGRDTLERERAGFAEQAARTRPVVLSEANVFDGFGRARVDLQAQREWASELLPLVHEILPLPAHALAPGVSWQGGSPLGLSFRAESWEEVGGEACLRLRGALRDEQVVLRAWWSPALGALRRLELDGRYPGVGRELREHLRFELVERARGEAPLRWLDEPRRRRGALAGLMLADAIAVEPARLEALLGVSDDSLRRDVLALLWRRRLPVAPAALAPLVASPDPRVRTLAVRLLDGVTPERARPSIRRALGDADAFVRAAALGWLRRRLPPEAAMRVRHAAAAERAWDALAPALREPETSAGSPLAEARCGASADWAEAALRERRAAAEPPGVRLSLGSRDAARGQPYVVRVPEDYRGDEPVPLLVYMSGGPGRALAGWSTAFHALEPTGYLAVFPQAGGMWWDAEPERRVASLLDEVLARYNVDTNRVYLAGFSNGGTAALRYAALWPDRFAAAVSLMGAGMFVEGAAATPLAGVGRLPLLFVHGERDAVIPAAASRETVAELRRQVRGARVELRTLPAREHDLVLDDDGGLTLPFLERWRRDPFPREVAFALADLRAPRRYWIEVLEKDPGTARVEGRIDARGGIDLRLRRVRRLRLLLRRELLPGGELRVRIDGREVWRGTPRHDCSLLERTWRDTGDPFRAWSMEIPLASERH